MAIPKTHSSINTDLLHPEFKRRLEAFFQDDRIKGRVKVVSAVRTFAQQKYFWDGWVARKRGFNLAANPHKVSSSGFQGSYHMQQPKFDNWGYAVDLRITGRGITTGQVNDIAVQYGIVPVIKSMEWWHHQPCRVVNGKMKFFPAPALKGKGKQITKAKQDYAGIAAAIGQAAATIERRPLRFKIPYMRGPEVKILQQRLGAAGVYRYNVDGIFGRQTRKCVKNFQKRRLLTVDGIVGKRTWEALFRTP